MTIRIGDRFEYDVQPEHILGEGGMGIVYEGVDTLTSRKVAIKRLMADIVRDRPETLERFAREAEALRRLNHPNIVDVIATINEGNDHYIVMEYVPGGSLRDILDEHGPMPLRRVLDIALDVADALTRAHRLRIIHRDIKPGNILIAEDGTPRLTDFGVAHLEDKPDVTRTGAVVGTVNYLPPEALNGQPLDERADIWAFGVVLYEMLIGQRPFEGETVSARVTAILTRPMPDMAQLRYDVPVSVQSLLSRMMTKDPSARINSVRQVGAELEMILQHLESPTQVLPPNMPGPLSEPGRFKTPTSDYTPYQIDATDFDHNLQNAGLTRDISVDQMGDDASGTGVYPRATTAPQKAVQTPNAPAQPKRQMGLVLIAAALFVGLTMIAIVLLANGALNNQPQATAALLPAPTANAYRVLIAEIEPLSGATERDVARLILDDLEQRYEVANAYTNLDVTRYPEAITSQEEAVRVANRENAAVVVWGTYDDEAIRLDVQVGSVALFPTIHFPRPLIERIANVRLTMSNAQTETIAPYVAGTLAILHAADGNLVDWTRMVAIMPQEETLPQITTSQAAQTHCYLQQYLSVPEDAIACIDQAILSEPGNAILYWMRGMAHNRRYLIEFVDERLLPTHLNIIRDSADTDFDTAERLGPDNWAMPLYTRIDGTTFGNRKSNLIIENSLTDIEAAIRLRPDDWAPLYIRAELAFKNGDIASARDYINRALVSKPDVSLPYTSALLLALRAGDLSAAANHIEMIVSAFPDVSASSAMFDVLVGVITPESIVPGVVSHLVIGQYDAASSLLETFNNGNSSAGLFGGDDTLIMLSGIAQCGQGNYELAHLAFGNVINSNRDFMVARLLRASANRRLGNIARATNDLDTVRESEQAGLLAPYVAAIENGTLTCANFFELDDIPR